MQNLSDLIQANSSLKLDLASLKGVVFDGQNAYFRRGMRLASNFSGNADQPFGVKQIREALSPLPTTAGKEKALGSKFDFDALRGSQSGFGFMVSKDNLRSLFNQISNLGSESLNPSNPPDGSSLPGTHFNSCCCGSCSFGRRIDSGSGFNAGRSKWSQPNGKGTPVTITYAFDDQFNLSGLDNSQLKTLFTEALQTWSNYAPLNFVEVNDPGSGRNVDILVQDEYIDGRSNTLAYAFFPKGGDITFDNGERWSESLFLETAVHELGHSLGLGHESGTRSAIMFPSIQNRYSGSGSAFLFQDDINGIRSIYGSGKGSVKTLDGSPKPNPTPTPTPTPPPTPNPTPTPTGNLVVNGSFENNSVSPGRYRVFNRIQGWTTTSGRGIQVDKRTNQYGAAADGRAWVELDSFGNSGMRQDISTKAGKTYELSFEYTPRAGFGSDTNGIEVYWDGKLIDTVTGNGGRNNNWRTLSYKLEGGSGDKTGLEFKAIGKSDDYGGFLDNVIVKQVSSSNPAPNPKPDPTPKPDPAPIPDPTPNPTPSSETDLFDQEVLKLVNQERTQRGLKPLTLNQKLDQAADQYSKAMAEQDFFSHRGKDGSSPGDRIAKTGYQARTWGENIAAGYRTPKAVVRGWMNSSGHRANILNPNFTEMGLGYKSLRNDTGRVNYGNYWTQVFGASRGAAAFSEDVNGDALLTNDSEPMRTDCSELPLGRINCYQLGSSSDHPSQVDFLTTSSQDLLGAGITTTPNFLDPNDQHAQVSV